MKNNLLILTAAVISVCLAACSSLPNGNTRLEEARGDYRAAQARSQTTTFAAVEMKDAGDALETANSAWLKGESASAVDHLAYIAKQKVAIAEQTANQKGAENSAVTAGAERDRVRLAARTREVETAKLEAFAATSNAKASQLSAETAQRDAQAAQQSAETAQKTAAIAQKNEEIQRLNAQSNAVAAAAAQREAMAQKEASNTALASAAAAQQLAQQQAQQQVQDAQLKTADAESRTRQLEAQLKELEGKQTARGYVVTLGDVLFDTNKAQLKNSALVSLQKLAAFSKLYPLRKVVVEGFTDSVGSASSNMILSENRANSVLTALIGMGLSASRISAVGYGEAHPISGNDTFTGRQLNRRVEIIVSDDSGNIAAR